MKQRFLAAMIAICMVVPPTVTAFADTQETVEEATADSMEEPAGTGTEPETAIEHQEEGASNEEQNLQEEEQSP